MVSIIVRLFYNTGRLFSLVFSHKLLSLCLGLRDTFYSGWVASGINTTHKIKLEYPAVILGHSYIKIGKNFSSRARLRIEAYDKYLQESFSPAIIIGDHVCFNFDCHVGCIDKIVIKDNVLIGSRVLIIDHAHGDLTKEYLHIAPALRNLTTKGPVIIEENVWIGEGAAILPNVTIGANSIIGANAVVTKDIPANSIALGIPAKVYKTISK